MMYLFAGNLVIFDMPSMASWRSSNSFCALVLTESSSHQRFHRRERHHAVQHDRFSVRNSLIQSPPCSSQPVLLIPPHPCASSSNAPYAEKCDDSELMRTHTNEDNKVESDAMKVIATGSIPLCGKDAEWVVECPYMAGHILPLPDFTKVSFAGAGARTRDGIVVEPGGGAGATVFNIHKPEPDGKQCRGEYRRDGNGAFEGLDVLSI